MKRYSKDYGPYRQSYRHGGFSCLKAAGVLLIVTGLMLLFICIPGWAWAAAAGIALIAAGYLLICLQSGRR